MEQSQRKSVAWAINQLTDGLDGEGGLERKARDARTELVNLLDNDKKHRLEDAEPTQQPE